MIPKAISRATWTTRRIWPTRWATVEILGAVGDVMDTAMSVASIIAAPVPFLAGLSGQIGVAVGEVSDLVEGADETLQGLGAIVAGGDPVSMVETLVTASGAADTIASAFALKNTLTRLGRNVGAITG